MLKAGPTQLLGFESRSQDTELRTQNKNKAAYHLCPEFSVLKN